MVVDPQRVTRSRKRSAASITQAEEEDAQGDAKPTPASPESHPTFKVVVQSPPNTRPTQRRRTSGGPATSGPVEATSSEVPASEQLWVGRGAVSNIHWLVTLFTVSHTTSRPVAPSA
jgi:hypothetical protein